MYKGNIYTEHLGIKSTLNSIEALNFKDLKDILDHEDKDIPYISVNIQN